MTIDDLDILWTTPSQDPHGSLPLGNGELGLNAWIDPAGDLVFYVGRSDSWSAGGHLLKVGRVRVSLTPAPWVPGAPFAQRLHLGRGELVVRFGAAHATTLRLWVDAHHPVIQVEVDSPTPLTLTARIESWRLQAYTPAADSRVSDPYSPRQSVVEPDRFLDGPAGRIGWYRHNAESFGPRETMAFQGLADDPGFVDPLKDRVFGAVVTGRGGRRVDATTLVTAPATAQALSVYCTAAHPSDPAGWLADLNERIATVEAVDPVARQQAHADWWQAFWARSWIHIRQTGDQAPAGPPAEGAPVSDATAVTRAYALQRYVNACAGRGAYPIKFNGSIFTVPHEGCDGDADYRLWGPGYWWQNTRLPYISMCTSGDLDLMAPLLRMYVDVVWPLCEYRTRTYFGFDGAYLPECIHSWGAVFPDTYGHEQRAAERQDKLQTSGYHKWEWVAGPELAALLLDVADHTDDETFRRDKALPLARSAARFFENYYRVGDDGKLVMHPSQAAETWWEVTNPMPELAGLAHLCERIVALPDGSLRAADRAFWTGLAAKLPELPLRATPDGPALAPGAAFADKRNVENPELYAVYPFRQVAVGRPHLEWGVNALTHRWDKGAEGWRQDDIFMAWLGLSDQARDTIVARARTWHEGSRFPAFWGPNYDWIPDQDHGGVLLKAVQSLLLQTDGRTIYLLPAWPAGWDVDFRLHAPHRTVVQGRVRDGFVVDLEVTPAARRADVVVLGGSEPGPRA